MTAMSSKVLTAAAIAAAVAVALTGAGTDLWIAHADRHGMTDAAVNGAVVLSFAIVGAVVTAARPANRVGRFMLAGGTLWALGEGLAALASHGLVADPGSVPAVSAAVLCAAVARSVSWTFITLAVPLHFPDGGSPGRRSRILLWAVLVASVVDPLADPAADTTGIGHWHNPLAPSGAWRAVSAMALLAHLPLGVAGIAVAVVRLVRLWRGGDALLRQRVTFFAAAVALPVVAVPLSFAADAGGWIFGASAVPLPFAIGFAILAHGLYDLRTAANRTLLWVTLSAVVAGLYALVIGGVGGLLRVPGDVWLPWAAAAVVAVSFAPLRDGLQRGVNRLTFGRWDEPYEVLAGLGQRLEASTDVDGLLAETAAELGGLGLADVRIRGGDGAVLAGAGDGPADDQEVIVLAAYGEPVGSLCFSPPATPPRPKDRRLLDDLAGHLGGLLYAHRLTGDLRQALERLVLAREEERRRLRRDLHDGLGPALAGHVLRLEVLAAAVGETSPAAAQIEILREDLRTTVLEVRRVVEGLRPPALDELGLAGAIRQAVRRLTAGAGLTVGVEVAELPRLTAALEVAAFRIVTEAVTNVVRHGAATDCRVEVGISGGRLRILVRDDGAGLPGGPDRGGGHGLQTMRERAEELRGRLQLISAAGTTVLAELPLAPA